MPDSLPPRVIAEVTFVGRSSGAVKSLEGFRKGHHAVPDAANPVTNAFLGRICAGELAGQAEDLFQRVRNGLGYKRRQVALAVTSPAATLTARDFTVELTYALEAQDPSRYVVTTTLRDVRSADLLRTAEVAEIFAGRFSEIGLGLRKGVAVEAVIDAIEALEETVMRVDYPSDCGHCTITVAGVDVAVRCTGAALEVVFPRAAGPAELLDAFAEVRAAFQISKVLRGLIG